MKIFLIILVSLFFGQNAFATQQYEDLIIYNGKKHGLLPFPLEELFQRNPDKKIPKSKIMSTALWRGYVATFEIRDKQLFLNDIEIQYRDATDTTMQSFMFPKWKSVIDEVFPNKKDIKIDWFTGILEMTTCQCNILLEIDKGNLTKEMCISNASDYEDFKERQFEAFKQTEDYKKIKDEYRELFQGDDIAEYILKLHVIDVSPKILVE